MEAKKNSLGVIMNLEECWINTYEENFKFIVMGFIVSGTMKISDCKIEIILNVPFRVGAFKGRLEKIIEDELEKDSTV